MSLLQTPEGRTGQLDHRAEALTTCRHLINGDPNPQLTANGLDQFLAQIRRFAWAPSAQVYDTARSSGSTGPIEAHRIHLLGDPARRSWRAFVDRVEDAEGKLVGLGWRPARPYVGHRLVSIRTALASPFPIGRQPLGEVQRQLNLARIIQLAWTQPAQEMRGEQRTCRHCGRTDLGSKPRGGWCTSCDGFRVEWKRLPNKDELSRFERTGRWRVRA